MSHTSSKKAARRKGSKHNRRKGVYMAMYKRRYVRHCRYYLSNASIPRFKKYFTELRIPTAVMRLK